jgi:radical SAM/Cys-rich protein
MYTEARQVELLDSCCCGKSFDESLAECELFPLMSTRVEILQINLGRLCNQRCAHCHVDAGPDRHEIMSRKTMQQCLDTLAASDIPVVDLTGGAPEMNPDFRWFVAEARALGRHLVDRSNLTILMEPDYDELPEFLAQHRVEIIASLPCYLEENVDSQRGDNVFTKSLLALRRLNSLGYGQTGSGLQLSLVHNPVGPVLPPPAKPLQEDYRKELRARWSVVFNRLLTMTNMPVGRFLQSLVEEGSLDEYMNMLVSGFNPAAAARAMCRTTLSVDFNGRLFDCDFNQMLGLGLKADLPQHISQFDAEKLAHRQIIVGRHCYGCTAGTGSGCQGALVEE